MRRQFLDLFIAAIVVLALCIWMGLTDQRDQLVAHKTSAIAPRPQTKAANDFQQELDARSRFMTSFDVINRPKT